MKRILGTTLAGLLLVGLFAAPASAWYRPSYFDGRTDGCNPLTYGRPNSCHTAPVVQTTTRTRSEVLDTDTGYGRAAVFAWSRGYHRVMLYAEYHGRADVRLTINCQASPSRTYSWTDYGPRFRVVRSVPAWSRCNYTATIRTTGGRVFLGIGAF